jgi:hypothetical protein
MRNAFAQRLRHAGLTVSTEGQDWLTAGDLSAALASALSAVESASAADAPVVVDKAALRDHIEELLNNYDGLKSQSKYDDLSDRPRESLTLAIQAQALVDRLGEETTYAEEAKAVRREPVHERLPALMSILEALLVEIWRD